MISKSNPSSLSEQQLQDIKQLANIDFWNRRTSLTSQPKLPQKRITNSAGIATGTSSVPPNNKQLTSSYVGLVRNFLVEEVRVKERQIFYCA